MIQLQQMISRCLIEFRFLLWDLDNRAYSYIVEVSQDRSTWVVVFDATQLFCRSWQIIKFPLQPVTFIRITGTGNTANDVFHLVHLECPASLLDVTDDTAAEEESRGNMHQHTSSQSSRTQLLPIHTIATNSVVGTSETVGDYVDTVSALRHQRPRLLEVEELSTPSSSLVADLSTFSLHSEVTLDAAGAEITGGGQFADPVPPQPPILLSHHQSRRRRRIHRGSRPPNEEFSAVSGSIADPNASANEHFPDNLRTSSLSSVLRDDTEVTQQINLLNDDSSLESSDAAPSEHS